MPEAPESSVASGACTKLPSTEVVAAQAGPWSAVLLDWLQRSLLMDFYTVAKMFGMEAEASRVGRHCQEQLEHHVAVQAGKIKDCRELLLGPSEEWVTKEALRALQDVSKGPVDVFQRVKAILTIKVAYQIVGPMGASELALRTLHLMWRCMLQGKHGQAELDEPSREAELTEAEFWGMLNHAADYCFRFSSLSKAWGSQGQQMHIPVAVPSSSDRPGAHDVAGGVWQQLQRVKCELPVLPHLLGAGAVKLNVKPKLQLLLDGMKSVAKQFVAMHGQTQMAAADGAVVAGMPAAASATVIPPCSMTGAAPAAASAHAPGLSLPASSPFANAQCSAECVQAGAATATQVIPAAASAAHPGPTACFHPTHGQAPVAAGAKPLSALPPLAPRQRAASVGGSSAAAEDSSAVLPARAGSAPPVQLSQHTAGSGCGSGSSVRKSSSQLVLQRHTDSVTKGQGQRGEIGLSGLPAASHVVCSTSVRADAQPVAGYCADAVCGGSIRTAAPSIRGYGHSTSPQRGSSRGQRQNQQAGSSAGAGAGADTRSTHLALPREAEVEGGWCRLALHLNLAGRRSSALHRTRAATSAISYAHHMRGSHAELLAAFNHTRYALPSRQDSAEPGLGSQAGSRLLQAPLLCQPPATPDASASSTSGCAAAAAAGAPGVIISALVGSMSGGQLLGQKRHAATVLVGDAHRTRTADAGPGMLQVDAPLSAAAEAGITAAGSAAAAPASAVVVEPVIVAGAPAGREAVDNHTDPPSVSEGPAAARATGTSTAMANLLSSKAGHRVCGLAKRVSILQAVAGRREEPDGPMGHIADSASAAVQDSELALSVFAAGLKHSAVVPMEGLGNMPGAQGSAERSGAGSRMTPTAAYVAAQPAYRIQQLLYACVRDASVLGLVHGDAVQARQLALEASPPARHAFIACLLLELSQHPALGLQGALAWMVDMLTAQDS